MKVADRGGDLVHMKSWQTTTLPNWPQRWDVPEQRHIADQIPRFGDRRRFENKAIDNTLVITVSDGPERSAPVRASDEVVRCEEGGYCGVESNVETYRRNAVVLFEQGHIIRIRCVEKVGLTPSCHFAAYFTAE